MCRSLSKGERQCRGRGKTAKNKCRANGKKKCCRGRRGNEIAGEMEGGNEATRDKEVMPGLVRYKDTGHRSI